MLEKHVLKSDKNNNGLIAIISLFKSNNMHVVVHSNILKYLNYTRNGTTPYYCTISLYQWLMGWLEFMKPWKNNFEQQQEEKSLPFADMLATQGRVIQNNVLVLEY